jgi:ribonuclease E
VATKAKESKPPALLYEESDIDLRSVRDFFTPDMEEVVVDSRPVYDRLVSFFEGVMPRHRERLKLYEGTTPLFHRHGIEAQVDQLNQKAVPLPSGGSLVIEQTEAMTAIDVNSGRLVREASPGHRRCGRISRPRAVMRQLRLRDVGGVIVIDFIDMKQERNRRRIESELRDEARKDRAQTVILPMSAFCLAQIARQKIRPSVASVAHDPCPACGGTGLVKSIESIGLEVMRALKGTLDREDIATVEVRVGPEVFALLESRKAEIQDMELKYKKRIRPQRVRDQPDHRVEFTCYSQAGDKVVDIVR